MKAIDSPQAWPCQCKTPWEHKQVTLKYETPMDIYASGDNTMWIEHALGDPAVMECWKTQWEIEMMLYRATQRVRADGIKRNHHLGDPLPRLAYDRASVRALVPHHRYAQPWGYIPTVYRVYDGEGKLAYGGATVHPRTRLLRELKDGRTPSGAMVSLQFMPTVQEMAEAERQLISSEAPFLNKIPHRRHYNWALAIAKENEAMRIKMVPPVHY